jgi:3'5'-cyclic nucleotide phosphodiesterase
MQQLTMLASSALQCMCTVCNISCACSVHQLHVVRGPRFCEILIYCGSASLKLQQVGELLTLTALLLYTHCACTRINNSRNSVRVGGGATLSNTAAAAEPDTYLIGDSVEDRLNLLEMLVHCSDLSGQVMTTHLALEWGRRILQEFRNQVRSAPTNNSVTRPL